MKFDIFTGKTLDEALEEAVTAKGVSKEELHYSVIEEKSGFLGIGKQIEIEAYAERDIEIFIKEYIQQFFDNAELDGQVQISNENGFYRVSVDTSNNAILIGRNGRVLQSFNRLVKVAASARFKKKIGLLIDVNGYKKDRYDKLCRMAVRVAKDVRRTKIDASLDPMTADERKAVHNSLAAMNNISTHSEGEGMNRHINILYTPGKEVE